MASSTFLPQALFMVPRSGVQCQPKNLAFSAAVSPRRPGGGSLSRVSTGFYFAAEKDKSLSLSFFVRAAEAEAQAQVEEESASESVVESEEAAEEEVLAEEEEEEEEKPPAQPRIKLGDIMGILNKRAIEASDKERPIPDLRVGDIVEIKLEVPENRRRLSIYKGIIMSKQNAGIHTTIRIRRVIAGVGVEIVFPVYSPNIKEIKVLKHRKVRRARLYFLREKLPRLSTFK